jgi:hypothetical protein
LKANKPKPISGDALALQADLLKAVDESWKRNEAGYRYLATEGMSVEELREALAKAQTGLAERDALRSEVARLRGIVARVVMNGDMLIDALAEDDDSHTAEGFNQLVAEARGEVASWGKQETNNG